MTIHTDENLQPKCTKYTEDEIDNNRTNNRRHYITKNVREWN